MKDLITTVASVLILMMFMTQFAANEKTYIRIFAADSIISGYEKTWQERGEIPEQELNSLNNELGERLNGKVVVDSLDRSQSAQGIYSLKMKVYDVIGPYKLISSYTDENAAVRVRDIRIEKPEESEDEDDTEEVENPEGEAQDSEKTGNDPEIRVNSGEIQKPETAREPEEVTNLSEEEREE